MTTSVRPQSWAPSEETQLYPDPLLVLAMFALALLFFGLLAVQNGNCLERAGDDPVRQARCAELNR